MGFTPLVTKSNMWEYSIHISLVGSPHKSIVLHLEVTNVPSHWFQLHMHDSREAIPIERVQAPPAWHRCLHDCTEHESCQGVPRPVGEVTAHISSGSGRREDRRVGHVVQ